MNRSTAHRRAKRGAKAAVEALAERRALVADLTPANLARYLWSAAGMYEALPDSAREVVDAEIDRRRLEIDDERAERTELYLWRANKRAQRRKEKTCVTS